LYTRPRSMESVYYLIITVYLASNCLFHYIVCCFSDTLTPTEQTQEELIFDGNREVQSHYGEYCKKCFKKRTIRTHHCYVCNKCVINMDHHCPVVNNCVSSRNNKHFILFLLYLFTGSIYGKFYILPTDPSIIFPLYQQGVAVIEFYKLLYSLVEIAILLSAIVLVFQFYLISTGQRTSEFLLSIPKRIRMRNFINEYDMGFKNNWSAFFRFL